MVMLKWYVPVYDNDYNCCCLYMEDFSTGVYVVFMILDLAVNHAGALAGKRLLVDADNARTVQSLLLLCNVRL